MSTPKRILIVEDEMMIALHIEDTLQHQGHQVATATSAAEANRRLDAGEVDLAIVDYKVSDGTTDELIARLRVAGVPFIVCSGFPEEQHGRVSAPMLAKPFTSDSLLQAVSALMGERSGDDLH